MVRRHHKGRVDPSVSIHDLVRCPTCGQMFPSLKRQVSHAIKSGHAPLMSADLAKLVARYTHCTWCGLPVDPYAYGEDEWRRPTREHLIPKVQGGGRGNANIQVAHLRCNQMRATMDEAGFRKLMRGESATREELWPWLYTSSASVEPRSSPPTGSGDDPTSGISTGTSGRRRRSRRGTSPSSPGKRSQGSSTSTPSTTASFGSSPDTTNVLSSKDE